MRLILSILFTIFLCTLVVESKKIDDIVHHNSRIAQVSGAQSNWQLRLRETTVLDEEANVS